MKEREIIIVCGYNAAGKSTVVEEFKDCCRFNRDIMGGSLDQQAAEVAKAIDAGHGRIVLDNTYPTIEIDEDDVSIGHEASVSKVGEEQLFYLMSRGLDQAEATTMVVSGFIEPLVKELPMEYAVEMNRLIQLQMEGSVG